MRRSIRILELLLFAFVTLHPLHGQLPGLPSSTPAKTTAEADPLGRDTPYGCVVGFLRAAEREDFTRAAQYLEGRSSPRSLELARQLYVVLNTVRATGLDTLSRSPEGDLNDGLSPTRERIGAVDTPEGKFEFLLERVRGAGPTPIWLFSSETLRDVPDAFEQVDIPGIVAYIPQGLRETKLFSVPLYRWLETVFGVLLAMGLASIGSRILFPAIRPLVRRITGEQDDRRLDALRPPLWPIILALGFRALAGLAITVLGRRFWVQCAAAMSVVGITWLVVRISDVIAARASRRLTRSGALSKVAILSLFHRLSKIAVGIAAIVIVIYLAGGDVTAILAGVGLGGIVIALAAQKTLENLFGGVALISDEPLRVGDFCRFNDKFGVIEDIGLRSARVRTIDRTMLSIPNGQLSLMTLENYTLRDKYLFRHRIDLRYATTPAQLRDLLAGIRGLLRDHPKVDQGETWVRLIEFAPSAFRLDVFAYLIVVEYTDYLALQEDLLLAILDVVVAAGSGLAYPSQTLYIEPDREES